DRRSALRATPGAEPLARRETGRGASAGAGSPSPAGPAEPGAKVSSPTETERCIESLIAVFQKHAGRDGNNSKLSKAEFLIFMNTELGAFTKNQKDPGVLDRMMKKLDLNSDGQLDFQEFLNLIGGLAIACHESFIKSASSQK
uniref:Protein S100 n=2 Tax=Bos TaxID=9903 RepID=A0ABI0NLF3_BOVIN